MRNLMINPATGEYGKYNECDYYEVDFLRITRNYIPQFNIDNKYVGMMEFGRFHKKEHYASFW